MNRFSFNAWADYGYRDFTLIHVAADWGLCFTKPYLAISLSLCGLGCSLIYWPKGKPA